MIKWDRGRAEVEQLLKQSRLTPVHPNSELADEYIATAKQRLEAVEAIRTIDPSGAFVLAYDAARLALAAILVNQGLRPRGEGAHAVLLEVVVAQLEPPRREEFRQFSWMRQLRNDTQYPDLDRPTATADDLEQAIPAAAQIIESAEAVIPHMPAF